MGTREHKKAFSFNLGTQGEDKDYESITRTTNFGENENQDLEVSLFPTGDHKVARNRKDSITKTKINQITKCLLMFPVPQYCLIVFTSIYPQNLVQVVIFMHLPLFHKTSGRASLVNRSVDMAACVYTIPSKLTVLH